MLERKSDIIPLLKTLCWCSHLKDMTRAPQGSMPCSPTLDLAHASPVPCHTYPVSLHSELLLASKGSGLLHANLLCWEYLSPCQPTCPPAHSCLSLSHSAQHHQFGKAFLGSYPSPFLGLSTVLSWSILVGSMEASLLGCELLRGQEPFLFSLGIFGTEHSAATADI